MIAVAQIEIILQPWLGPRLCEALFPLFEEIAALLNSYAGSTPPESLAAQIDSMLFQAVRMKTGKKMLMELPDGGFVRIQVEDFSVMADELLFPVFASFPVDQQHFSLLKEYSLRASSLSALRVLYTRFSRLQTREELDAIALVARKCYPAFRLRGWLI